MLHNLARLSHPLAAFLVARTIPQLIRDQEEDGMWSGGRGRRNEDVVPGSGRYENNLREVTSFRVLMALKRFSFLSSLVPKYGAVPHTADDSVKQKRSLLTLQRRSFIFMEASDVVSVSELVGLGAKRAFFPPS